MSTTKLHVGFDQGRDSRLRGRMQSGMEWNVRDGGFAMKQMLSDGCMEEKGGRRNLRRAPRNTESCGCIDRALSRMGNGPRNGGTRFQLERRAKVSYRKFGIKYESP